MASGSLPDPRPADAPGSSSSTADPLADARLELRLVGYCTLCDALVERTVDGSCSAGHPAQAISGRIVLDDGEPIPVLPRFNIAAFFIPPIWGPAHGIWVGAIFLPIWLFADSAIFSAARVGGWMWIPAVLVLAGTLAFEYFFARRANGVAFRRVMHKLTAEQFAARQRVWAFVAVPVGVALIGWGIYFDIVLAPALKR